MEHEHSGGGYELPNTSDISTPEQASQALNKLWADVGRDPAHPYMNPNHPQNKDFVKRANELNRIKYQDEDPRSPLEQAMAAGLEKQQQDRDERIEQAEQVLDELAEHGYERPDVPDDILPCELEVLQMQLFAARGEWSNVTERLRQSVEQLPGTPAHVRESFFDYQRAPNNDEKLAHATAVLRYVRDAGRARLGLKPRQAKGDQ